MHLPSNRVGSDTQAVWHESAYVEYNTASIWKGDKDILEEESRFQNNLAWLQEE